MGYCISNLITTLLIWLWQTCSVTLSMAVSIHLLQVEPSCHLLWWFYYRREHPSGCRWRNNNPSKVRVTVLHLVCDATTVRSEQKLRLELLIHGSFDWRGILIQIFSPKESWVKPVVSAEICLTLFHETMIPCIPGIQSRPMRRERRKDRAEMAPARN
jgi:hypothetical protein